MGEVNKDTIRHIAKLARLGLSEEEIDRFAGQIEDTMAYIDMIDAVDTDGIEETAQVTGLTNMYRDDVIDESWFDKDGLLDASPLPVDGNQIVVKNVFDNE